MDKEICTIEIGKGVLDDDYTFYESGKVKHFYDQSIYKPNVEKWLEAHQIDDFRKGKIIEKCPEVNKEQITKLLFPNLT